MKKLTWKEKFQRWIGIEGFENKLEILRNENKGLRKTVLEQGNALANQQKQMDNLAKLYKVAVDVSPAGHEGSWAVVCLKGQKDFVSFVQLGQRDVQEIGLFLRQFEQAGVRGSSMIIDSGIVPRNNFFK